MLIPKDEWERKIFSEFAEAAGLAVDVGSVSSGNPPEPDIRFTVAGRKRWAELVEITDQDLAQKHMTSLKTAAITGGFFSQRVPLERSIRAKAAKTYRTRGSQLDLVAYYDKQFPPTTEPNLVPETIGPIAADMVGSGVWAGVWVYDAWSRSIVWAYLADPA